MNLKVSITSRLGIKEKILSIPKISAINNVWFLVVNCIKKYDDIAPTIHPIGKIALNKPYSASNEL